MNKAFDTIDAAIREIKTLRTVLKRRDHPQVRSNEERSLIKATVLSWFSNHRLAVLPLLDEVELDNLDQFYNKALQACDRATARKTYDNYFKNILQELSKIKVHIVMPKQPILHTKDDPPDFSPLIAGPQMQAILVSRWRECSSCISGGAPLAATVMMGGFLEALLLARINTEPDQSKVFKSKTAPTDHRTGKALNLKDWTLRNYIDVAHELRWISQSAKDISEVLRDYRNYVHPHKQLSHNVELSQDDAILFWEITKSISRQLLFV